MRQEDIQLKEERDMLYAAYGSNLNKYQMLWRCPGASKAGTAVIKGYRLMFKGSRSGAYLTIEKAKGCEVPVGLWNVTESDIKNLDRYEGYPNFYYKKTFVAECSDGKRHRIFAYIMHEERPLGIPSQYYVDVCTEGYGDFGFDLDVLKDAIEYTARGVA
jgi:gamma-glutamylcyclotransferase (GGCT)/AIG2-like uncharacterized protein YtfP